MMIVGGAGVVAGVGVPLTAANSASNLATFNWASRRVISSCGVAGVGVGLGVCAKAAPTVDRAIKEERISIFISFNRVKVPGPPVVRYVILIDCILSIIRTRQQSMNKYMKSTLVYDTASETPKSDVDMNLPATNDCDLVYDS